MTRTQRPHRHDDKQSERRRTNKLLVVSGRVRSIGLTPQGHLACVFDTSAGRLKALSDAGSIHSRELAVGRAVQVTLLRLKRVTDDAVWHWHLLGCRGQEDAAPAAHAECEGSLA